MHSIACQWIDFARKGTMHTRKINESKDLHLSHVSHYLACMCLAYESSGSVVTIWPFGYSQQPHGLWIDMDFSVFHHVLLFFSFCCSHCADKTRCERWTCTKSLSIHSCIYFHLSPRPRPSIEHTKHSYFILFSMKIVWHLVGWKNFISDGCKATHVSLQHFAPSIPLRWHFITTKGLLGSFTKIKWKWRKLRTVEKQHTNSVRLKKKVLNEFAIGAFGSYITIDRTTWYRTEFTIHFEWLLSASRALSPYTIRAINTK